MPGASRSWAQTVEPDAGLRPPARSAKPDADDFRPELAPGTPTAAQPYADRSRSEELQAQLADAWSEKVNVDAEVAAAKGRIAMLRFQHANAQVVTAAAATYENQDSDEDGNSSDESDETFFSSQSGMSSIGSWMIAPNKKRIEDINRQMQVGCIVWHPQMGDGVVVRIRIRSKSGKPYKVRYHASGKRRRYSGRNAIRKLWLPSGIDADANFRESLSNDANPSSTEAVRLAEAVRIAEAELEFLEDTAQRAARCAQQCASQIPHGLVG